MSRARPVALYRRLPPGPSRMGREEVARNQRARVYGAMIEAVDRRGYDASSVADVIALAGVSRRAFYEQFPNKQACFLATHDIVVARARKLMLDAWRGEHGRANRLHASCRALLEDVAAAPKGARLALVEAPRNGPDARRRMQLAGRSFEQLVATGFDSMRARVRLPALAPRAIVGGVRQLLTARLRQGREAELAGLSEEVLDWAESYSAPGGVALTRRAGATRRRLPERAAFLQRADPRSRLLAAAYELTLAHGRPLLNERQIARVGASSMEAFHRHFASGEECYLALLREFKTEACAAVRIGCANAEDWPQAVHLAMGAFVEHLAAYPALTRLAFVDVLELDPRLLAGLPPPPAALGGLFRAGAPQPKRSPLLSIEALSGGLWEILSGFAQDNRLALLPAFVDQLTFLVLAPYLGPRGALAAVEGAHVRSAAA